MKTASDICVLPERDFWHARDWVCSKAEGEEIEPSDIPAPRKRAPANALPDVDSSLAGTLLSGTITSSNEFFFAGRFASLRPTATRLLVAVWRGRGSPILVTDIARQVWGRAHPPCRATLDTTLFRANAALLATRFPHRLSYCHPYLGFRPTTSRLDKDTAPQRSGNCAVDPAFSRNTVQ